MYYVHVCNLSDLPDSKRHRNISLLDNSLHDGNIGINRIEVVEPTLPSWLNVLNDILRYPCLFISTKLLSSYTEMCYIIDQILSINSSMLVV